MARTARKAALPAPPPIFTAADHDTIRAMGLEIMYWQHVSVLGDDGRAYTIPQHLAGHDGDITLILWIPAGTGNYNFDGWEPQLGPFRHGGRYRELASALHWVQVAREVRDGKRTDFRGA